eukprot:Hpha_TRINITY_DN36532_c0_g1::TRINITY_DN36532_c0_g1_i1::g.130730::m.130730
MLRTMPSVRPLWMLVVVGPVVQGCIVAGVSSGSTHTCALMTTVGVKHSLKCWGRNTNGELGQGDATARGTFPGQMGAVLPFLGGGSNTEVFAYMGGVEYGCAFDTTSQSKGVFCWGSNRKGNLGVGDLADRGSSGGLKVLDSAYSLPAVPVPASCTVLEVAVYSAHACLLCSDRESIYCWGSGTNGRLGVGDSNDRGGKATFITDPWPKTDLGVLAGGVAGLMGGSGSRGNSALA